MFEAKVDQLVAQQHAFFYAGSTRSADFRIAMLKRLYEGIVQHEQAILDALHADLRKSPFEVYTTEIGFVLSSISFAMKHLEEWMEPQAEKTPLHLQPAKSFIVREPYGSALIIGPFNYPFQLAVDPLVGAIAGGNCAVVKPSETAPETAKIVSRLIGELFPPDYIAVVEGGAEETSVLLKAPFDYIFFTGSAAVGKIVMKAAAERLTPFTLELGGKSPAIVDQTADLAIAAERIAWGKFVNNGQTCVAPDYVYVHDSVRTSFIRELKKAIRRFYGKDASKSRDYGRIINEKQFDKLKGLLDDSKSSILYGGSSDRRDLYIEPTLLDTPSFEDAAMQEEIFGPILPILSYQNLGAAINEIRQLPKPLAGYMFTENSQAADYFIEQLPFGGGCINDCISHVANIHLPFGGTGPSGINAYHGKASFETFTHAKSMMKKSTAIQVRAAFPPYGKKLAIIKPLLR